MTTPGIDLFTAHGGRVDAARAAFGGTDWIDLSTGIAPWPYPVGQGALAALSTLPEPAALAALERAAARAFAVPPSRAVVAVPGSDIAMRLLAGLLPRRAAVVRPGYAGHAAAWPEAASIPDLASAGTADCVILASPNNPDGRIADPAAVVALARRGTIVVADEAFADGLDGGVSGSTDEPIVVLRSFGKYYGLPGLRLGFVVCAPDLAARLRAVLGDWPVSSLAIAVGTVAYADRAWQAEQARRIAQANDRLDAALTGFAVAGRTSLFRLVETPDAHRLFHHLAARAILVRPFAERRDQLRVGLSRDAAAAERLADALRAFAA
jgi:cobalamin biosynthesis protein CobC